MAKRTTRRHAGGQATARERLLDAAERLFAEHGFAATSVRSITDAARCNLAAVNYHFGGKLGLYETLFRSRLSDLRLRRVDSIRHLPAHTKARGALEALLVTFGGAFLEPFVEEGQGRRLLSLLSREQVDPYLSPQLFQQEVVAPVRQALSDALRAVAPGLRREQAARCVVSIIGQLVQVSSQCHWTAAVDGGRIEGPHLASMVEHIARFSAAGVRACAKGRQRRG